MGNVCVVASHEDDDIFCATDEQNESLVVLHLRSVHPNAGNLFFFFFRRLTPAANTFDRDRERSTFDYARSSSSY